MPQAHKHLHLSNRKQEVLGVEVARLEATDSNGQPVESVPLVATVEADRITVFWWNSQANRWSSIERTHQPTTLLWDKPSDVLGSAWSSRAALVGGTNRAVLLYKRKLSATDTAKLYIDTLEWNAAGGLGFVGAPTAIPVSDLGYERTGFWLWAGHEGPNLLVLTQGVKVETTYRIVPGSGGHRFNPWYPGLPMSYAFSPLARDPRFALLLRDPVMRDTLAIPAVTHFFEDPRVGEILRDVRIVPPDPHGPGIPSPEFDLPGKPWPIFPDLGNDPQLVPVQTEKPRLLLLRADFSADFGNAVVWKPLDIDEGGFDFDATLSNGRVACVYRRRPHAFEATATVVVNEDLVGTQTIPLAADGVDDPRYGQLSYREVSAAELWIDPATSFDNLPGGEHPQVQGLDPIVVTFDRVSNGEVEILPADPSEGLPVRARSNIRHFEKLLLQRLPTQAWQLRRLYNYPSWLPRSLSGHTQLAATAPPELTELSGSIVRYTCMLPYQPVYLLRFVLVADDKQGAVDILHHRFADVGPPDGFLAVTRYQLTPASATEVSLGILDINLIPLENSNGTDELFPRAQENRQFEPMFRSERKVDVTIGGCLVLHPDRAHPFYAYTDLGDGGCRAIVDGILTPAELPATPGKEVFGPSSMVAPGLAAEEFRDVEAGAWYSDTELPPYEVEVDPDGRYMTNGGDPGSLASGLHVVIDTLLFALRSLNLVGNENPVTIAEEQTQTLQIFLEDISEPEEPDVVIMDPEAGPYAPPLPTFTVSPPNPWDTSAVRLDASATPSIPYAITRYRWEVDSDVDEGGPELAIKVVPSLDHGNHLVRLTVDNAGGDSRHSNEAIATPGRVPGAPARLQAIATAAQVALTWLVPEAVGASPIIEYIVLRRLPEGDWVQLATTAVLSFADTTASAASRFIYAVRARNVDGVSVPSNEVAARRVSAPGPAQAFAASPGRSEITLSWQPPATTGGLTIQRYRVYRATSSSANFQRIGQVNGTTLSYVDNTAVSRLTYWYVVTAESNSGEGPFCNPLMALVDAPEPPHNLVASHEAGQVTLRWTPPTGPPVTEYRLYRKSSLGGAYTFLVSTAATQYDDLAVADGTTYYYVVVAANPGSATNSVQATVFARSMWHDDVWGFHEALRDSDYKIWDATIEFGKYRITYRHNGRQRHRVTFETSIWRTIFTLLRRRIALGFWVNFQSSDIELLKSVPVLGRLSNYVTVNSVSTQLQYSREFAMAVLMSDRRFKDPFLANEDPDEDAEEEFEEPMELLERGVDNGVEALPSALSAKPCSPTRVTVTNVEVDISLDIGFEAAATLVTLLVALGILLLAGELAALIATLEALLIQAGLTGPVGAAAVAAAIVATVAAIWAIIHYTAPLAIESYVEGRIEESLVEKKATYDVSPMMWYAGEGLAEAIARKVLLQAGMNPDEPAHVGRNRLREHFWQRIDVFADRCRVYFRR